MMDMPSRIFHTLYRAAWLESEAKRKEAEEAEKQARKEEQEARRRSGGRGPSSMSSRQAIEKMRGISGEDLEEIAEETGLA
jgi:hypothetical protein